MIKTIRYGSNTIRAAAANIITVSRMLFSLLLLLLPTRSFLFAASYLLCGVTDVLDGFVARRLHTESETGAMLDSAADLLFAVVYVVRILPLLNVPRWALIWAAVIAVIKIMGILIASRKTHKLTMEHSFGNKLTGLLLFLLPLSVSFADVKYGAAIVCIAATATVIREIINVKRYKSWL